MKVSLAQVKFFEKTVGLKGDTMTTREKFEQGQFKNKIPHPVKEVGLEEKYRKQRDEYYREQRKMTDKLRKSLEEEYGAVGHPKSDKLWNIAWEQGHHAGYWEVINQYETLVELLS
jgi:hypothetical protein